MKIYANQLEALLQSGLQSCYLIVGDEPLQRLEAADAIRNKAKAQGFTEREVLHVDKKFKWETLFSSMGTMSLFAEKKLMELYLPTGKPGAAGSKAIVQFVENTPADICLLIQCEQWTATNDKTKWVKTIEKQGLFMRVYMPKPGEFGQWLRNRCRKIGLRVEADTISLLAMRLEGNLLAANQELEKLKMRFAEQTISAKAVAGLVADSARFDVFRLTDALMENKLARVLRMIRSLKLDNTPIVVIHWSLERQLRQLLFFAYIKSKGQRVSPADYRKQGVWQNQQTAIQAVLNRLSVADLQRLIQGMAQLDRTIKGQAQGNAWLQLEQWAIKFCS
ncbi:MAG TPA: DNA polymerase III subunit delta [Oceanospirillales bacterium]|nr:DNA polymerase III subunit delta [Oceanospirillales bacterium]